MEVVAQMDRARGLFREVTGSSPVGSTEKYMGSVQVQVLSTNQTLSRTLNPYSNSNWAGSSDGESICLANRRSRVQVPPGPQSSTSIQEQYKSTIGLYSKLVLVLNSAGVVLMAAYLVANQKA